MSSPADKHARRLVGVLVLAGMTVSVQSTLGTPLIPTIAAEQHVSLETGQWMLTLTLLVGVVATPLLGRLGDGARREGAARHPRLRAARLGRGGHVAVL